MKRIITLLSFMFCASITQAQYWNNITSGTDKRLMSVSFGSPTVGYIGGADSLLLKTTDGGDTWQSVAYTGLSFSLSVTDIIHVNFVTADIGYAVTSNFNHPDYQGLLHKTTDGGLTWTPIPAGNIATWSTFFFDENNGYQVGSAFFVGHTVMELQNSVWQPDRFLYYGPDEFLYTIDCYDNNRCITGGSDGLVYRTFDGGTTWDTVSTGIDSSIYSLKFLNDSTIIGATYNSGGAIIVSTDSGATWQVDMNSLTFFYPQMRDMVLSDKDSFIAVGHPSFIPEDGVIMSGHNGWMQVESVDHAMNSVTMRDDSIAFAVGDSGLIVSNKQQTSGIGTPASAKPALTIFPNPSQGIFTTSMAEEHSVTVFDLTGRVVYENKNSRRYHSVDITTQAKGVYVVQAAMKSGRLVYKKVLVD